jgi:CDP-diacylglycerol--serine O-phosphatidyltransferase
MAPALMVYLWALQPYGRIGWLAGFLFMVCGALRLARFNTQSGSAGGNHFTGLPIPAAAGMSAATLLFVEKIGGNGESYGLAILIMMYVLSFLMVSTIHYLSFKKAEPFRKTNFNYLVAIVLVMIFIASQPSIALFLIGVTYIFSGPVIAVRKYLVKGNGQPDNLESEIQETKTR